MTVTDESTTIIEKLDELTYPHMDRPLVRSTHHRTRGVIFRLSTGADYTALEADTYGTGKYVFETTGSNWASAYREQRDDAQFVNVYGLGTGNHEPFEIPTTWSPEMVRWRVARLLWAMKFGGWAEQDKIVSVVLERWLPVEGKMKARGGGGRSLISVIRDNQRDFAAGDFVGHWQMLEAELVQAWKDGWQPEVDWEHAARRIMTGMGFDYPDNALKVLKEMRGKEWHSTTHKVSFFTRTLREYIPDHPNEAQGDATRELMRVAVPTDGMVISIPDDIMALETVEELRDALARHRLREAAIRDIFHSWADKRGMCDMYDAIVRSAGWPRRPVTLNVRITGKAKVKVTPEYLQRYVGGEWDVTGGQVLHTMAFDFTERRVAVEAKTRAAAQKALEEDETFDLNQKIVANSGGIKLEDIVEIVGDVTYRI